MAFSAADLDAFIDFLQQDPQARDRVREAILADDFRALPGLVRKLTARLDDLAVQVSALVFRLDSLTAQVHELTTVVGKVSGRTGNLEGEAYEARFVRHLPGRLSPPFSRVRELDANDARLLDAWESGVLSDADWKDLHRADALAEARDGRGAGAPAVFIALEISKTVDERDVSRADRRAGFLRRAGLEGVGCVAGERILGGAAVLAERLGVRALVEHEDDDEPVAAAV